LLVLPLQPTHCYNLRHAHDRVFDLPIQRDFAGGLRSNSGDAYADYRPPYALTFSDPAGDFVVNEPGVCTVEVQVLHDGMTSAGPVEPPYPTGGVLGSADGRFQVYVVPKTAARIDFGLPDFGLYALRFDGHLPGALRFFPRIPEGWSEVDGVYTISMSGFILEEGTLEPGEEVLDVVYEPVRLHEDFPNIDLRDRGGFERRTGAEPGLSDEVFISVLLSGTDASGQPVHAAKVITLVGEDIYDLN